MNVINNFEGTRSHVFTYILKGICWSVLRDSLTFFPGYEDSLFSPLTTGPGADWVLNKCLNEWMAENLDWFSTRMVLPSHLPSALLLLNYRDVLWCGVKLRVFNLPYCCFAPNTSFRPLKLRINIYNYVRYCQEAK